MKKITLLLCTLVYMLVCDLSANAQCGGTLKITPNGPINLCIGGSIGITLSGVGAGWNFKIYKDTINPANKISDTSSAIDTPLSSTVYYATADSAGCGQKMDNVIVNVNPKPATSAITGPDPVCYSAFQSYSVTSNPGSTYQWLVSGGSFPFSSTSNPVFVQWGSGPTGVLKVVETNTSGCKGDTVLLTITIFPAPATPVITGPDTLCSSDITTYSVSQYAGSSYLWYTLNGANVLHPVDSSTVAIDWGGITGTDTIYVAETDSNGCSSLNGTLPVLLYPVPPIPILAFRNCDTIITSNDTSYRTYQWYIDSALIPGATNNVFIISQNSYHIFTMRVCNEGGCCVSNAISNWACVEGVKNLYDEQAFSLSPNPVTNQITIHTSSFHANEAATVSIMNVLGQEAAHPLTPSIREGEDALIDVSKLAAGMYFLQIKTESASVVKRFVKE